MLDLYKERGRGKCLFLCASGCTAWAGPQVCAAELILCLSWGSREVLEEFFFSWSPVQLSHDVPQCRLVLHPPPVWGEEQAAQRETSITA